jgi:hypothetical protein
MAVGAIGLATRLIAIRSMINTIGPTEKAGTQVLLPLPVGVAEREIIERGTIKSKHQNRN